MKYILTLAVIFLGFSACKKDANMSTFDDSFNKWKAFKAASNNSYTYTAFESYFIGVNVETKITVQNGEVTACSFKKFQYNGPGIVKVLNEWTEDKASLNTHTDGDAHKTWPLDEVYDTAKHVWLKADKSKNDVYFNAANDGLISSCGYTPKSCMDDCTTGIYIKEIKKL